ncbi:N-acetylmuramoyl-L-alanine amidase [Thermochromatium tepidum]|uniref:N-acetylmuramoyl-L-alanine amidase AmiC n=1 Tax=Thermochromatium tepidum ATCC 43061 TaxID=316276 RepID=A0A6I6DZT7_THETI|nr:N-acetylmuramoyl-L-alanine amidase [Thermochromatium tepidum]QGU33221.1 AMIN domain-containing protein [Thermochromatium tepidum ATCC 43061]
MNRLIVLFMLLIALPAASVAVEVDCQWNPPSSSKTRLLFNLTAPAAHRIFTLDQPDRVVIDIAGAQMRSDLPAARTDDPLLIGVRAGVRPNGDLRVVLDLKQQVRVKSFTDRTGADRYQLIVELLPKSLGGGKLQPVSNQAPVQPLWLSRGRTAIVAIDAGHGGEDPGAIGPNGTREKDVTLAIAHRLKRLIERESGIRAIMIRDDDRYVGLRERTLIAREHKADLFVSIHADAYENPDAQGSSVYILSHGAASSEAAGWLADRENKADRIGGADPTTSEDMLAAVLLDMTRNTTLEHSAEAATSVLRALKRVGVVHKADVQRAGFVVLKSPDIPSVLVETAFISNAQEEQRLRDNLYLQRMAEAILAGIKGYFAKYPPRGLLAADTGQGVEHRGTDAVQGLKSASRTRAGSLREYVITQGDTLSGIAKRYRVSLSSLRAENGLSETDIIQVGQVIAIPSDS